MAKFHIPIDPNPECFVHIGEIVSRWGWIENQLTVLIRELLRLTKPEAHMAISNLSVSTKLGVLQSLAKHVYQDRPLAADIKQLAKRVQKFNAVRDDLIHGLWVHYPPASTKLALLRRESLEQRIDPQPDTDAPSLLPARIAQLRALQQEAQRITDAVKKRH